MSLKNGLQILYREKRNQTDILELFYSVETFAACATTEHPPLWQKFRVETSPPMGRIYAIFVIALSVKSIYCYQTFPLSTW